MTARALSIVFVLVALALAGCGDKGGGETSAGTSSTTAQTAPEEARTAPGGTDTDADEDRPATEREDDTRGSGGGGNREDPEQDGDVGRARTTPRPGSRAAFVRGAEEACRVARRELREVQRGIGKTDGTPDREELERKLKRAIDRQIAIDAATTRRIEQLDPPPGRADDVAELVALRKRVNQIRVDFREALEGDRSQDVAQLALRQGRGERKVSRLARRLGIRAC